MSNASRIRAGVVGVGHLGSVHARLWKQTGGAELVGVYDTDYLRTQKIAEEHGVRAFSVLDDLLNSVDAISIVTPTSAHAAVARQALEAGIHCFIEKPITVGYSEAGELAELASNSGCTVQVGHVERFNAALLAIQTDVLVPRFIESHRLARFSARALDVSVIHDLMIHDIDLALWLVKSRVVEIRASGVAVMSDEIDIANARLEFESGCVANLTASRISQKPMRKMRLFGRDSYISLDFAEPSAEVFSITHGAQSGNGLPIGSVGEGETKRTIHYSKPAVPEQNAIARELEEFVSAISTGDPPPVTAGDAAEAIRIAEEIVRIAGMPVN